MEATIKDIQLKLQKGAFPNEASISQGIVLRVIRELGWDVDDIEVVAPEYSIGKLRADFALCHPAGKPLVLIEVKQPGTMSAIAEEQLAHYAFQKGVPLVVLTSGSDWHFYAPYGPGEFRDRRIHRVDLTERTAEDAAERLRRYLSFTAWKSGTASISVNRDLQDMLSKQETRRRLPDAWQAILSEPHPQLVDILSTELERITGSEPPRGEVITFLNNKFSPKASTELHVKKLNLTKNPVQKSSYNQSSVGMLKLVINGYEIPVKTHRERYIKVLEYLFEQDPSILQRFHDQVPAGRRPPVAQSPEALWPKTPGFAAGNKSAWLELSSAPGWFVNLDKSGKEMATYIRSACDLAGVEIGTVIKIN